MTVIDDPTIEAGALAAGDWKVAPLHSSLGFSTRAMGFLPVRGSFRGLSGEVHVDRAGDVRGELTVLAESVSTGIKMRDRDLRGEKFLAIERYPHISFTLGSLAPAPDGVIDITGTLTIRDQKQLVKTAATVAKVGPDDVRIEADFAVDPRRAGFNPKGLPRSVRANASLMLSHVG